MAQNPERTIKEMTSLDLNQQPLCIEYPTLDVDFELKTGLIRLLPTFRGLAGLTEANRSLVDAARGDALYDKTPTEARKLIKTMAFNTQQFGSRNDNPPQRVNEDTRTSIQNLENQTRASIHNLESQVSQLASSVSRLESRGKLPSQTIINPKQNVSTITLCSEKELQFENSTRRGYALQNRTENSVVRGHAEQGKTGEEFKISPKEAENSNQVGEEHPKVFVSKPPFPERFAKSKKEEEEKEIVETLRKVEVNIPLLEAIKQVPRYAKFLKEMCINKSKLRENAMCDLGASINVMPLAIYESLNVGPLKETGVVLQLADRSIVYPYGVLEDVLVQINELVFPADFYVLDMTGDNSLNSTSILLGRPFLKTSRTKIDVDAGILSMEFDNEVPDSTNSSATAVAAPIPATVSTPPHRAHRRRISAQHRSTTVEAPPPSHTTNTVPSPCPRPAVANHHSVHRRCHSRTTSFLLFPFSFSFFFLSLSFCLLS
ncbi:UNVERIFIED_CONTAM: hypothetical protein Sradi_4403500 [Sesamum radiatum]|uniref:Uncharacterized protein n=1 Tax=Sesamum radiatum TaxID=300843 RepID=A0AAW2NP92_SESRA